MSGHTTGQLKGIIAANIREAIGNRTVASVARALDTHERNIRRWRNGEVTPSLGNLAQLADLLGVEDVAWFYTDHDADTKAAA